MRHNILLFSLFFLSPIIAEKIDEPQSFSIQELEEQLTSSEEVTPILAVLTESSFVERKEVKETKNPAPVCCQQLDDLSETISLRHREPGGVGYSNGYSTLAAAVVPVAPTFGYYFLDGRAHILNDGNFASNLGNGFRYKFKEHNSILGVNTYYDYRYDRANYQQLGVGLDFRKDRFFTCTNGYFPIVNPKKEVEESECIYPSGLVVKKKSVVQALSRWDLEEGYFFVVKDQLIFYAGVGPYFLWNQSLCESKTWGGMGHLKLNIVKYLTFEFFISHDSFFETKCQGLFSITFPNSSSKQIGVFPVFRQEIIPLKKSNEWEW
jgi:hypothetical protein